LSSLYISLHHITSIKYHVVGCDWETLSVSNWLRIAPTQPLESQMLTPCGPHASGILDGGSLGLSERVISMS
jgi:hypothetical protein